MMRTIGLVLLNACVTAVVALGVAGGVIVYAFNHQNELIAYARDVITPPPVEQVVDLKGLEMKLVQNLAKCTPENNACLGYAILMYNKERDPALVSKYEREARINLFAVVLNEAARDVQGRAAIAKTFKQDNADLLVELLGNIRKTQMSLNRTTVRLD